MENWVDSTPEQEFWDVFNEMIDDGTIEPKGVNEDGEVTYGAIREEE